MKTDIEIAQSSTMQHIRDIAKVANVEEKYLEQYGNYKAKVDYNLLKEHTGPDGKLILVTAITPTPAGEGKTTTTVGLADGLRKIGKRSVVALREPSLGPVFGLKGGAAGGGYAQVVPMEDINLHFTGDFHAIGAANNLLAAMLDNHIQQGNALGIDVKKITWKRCVDMNDRQLRNIVDGLGGRMQGVPREDGFDITVASEVMAVLCLASSITDLKERLSRMVVAYTYDDKPVTAGDLKAAGAMTALLKDALKPNLVQTQELAVRGGVLGDGDGGEAVFLLQGQHVAQRCVRGQVRGTDDEPGLAALHPADHGGLVLNGLRAVDEGQAALLGQGHGQGVVGDSLHDSGDHGDVQADGALLLPLAVLHQGGLQGDVVGYTLLRGEPRHQQVLTEGMGRFGIVKSHVRLLLSFFSKYHLKYSTAERKSFISYSPGTLRYRPAPVRSLWPILPNTRPSGEVMPSTAQTELLGLK